MGIFDKLFGGAGGGEQSVSDREVRPGSDGQFLVEIRTAPDGFGRTFFYGCETAHWIVGSEAGGNPSYRGVVLKSGFFDGTIAMFSANELNEPGFTNPYLTECRYARWLTRRSSGYYECREEEVPVRPMDPMEYQEYQAACQEWRTEKAGEKTRGELLTQEAQAIDKVMRETQGSEVGHLWFDLGLFSAGLQFSYVKKQQELQQVHGQVWKATAPNAILSRVGELHEAVGAVLSDHEQRTIFLEGFDAMASADEIENMPKEAAWALIKLGSCVLLGPVLLLEAMLMAKAVEPGMQEYSQTIPRLASAVLKMLEAKLGPLPTIRWMWTELDEIVCSAGTSKPVTIRTSLEVGLISSTNARPATAHPGGCDPDPIVAPSGFRSLAVMPSLGVRARLSVARACITALSRTTTAKATACDSDRLRIVAPSRDRRMDHNGLHARRTGAVLAQDRIRRDRTLADHQQPAEHYIRSADDYSRRYPLGWRSRGRHGEFR